jgi:hypothetical protein
VRTSRRMVGQHTDMTKPIDASRMYANATEYEHQYRGMPDECSLYVCCKLVCYDKINIILTRMFCKPFKDLWLLYTPPALA